MPSRFRQFLESIAIRLNESRLWRCEHRVWDQQMGAATFERGLYLLLHRLGLMGAGERSALTRQVKPGMTVVDVGGNLGLYTVLFSRLVGPEGRVFTFEPDPDLFAQLQQNCSRNGCANVQGFNLAVGSQHDHLNLQKLITNTGDNHLSKDGAKFFRRTIPVEVVALDEFLPVRNPDLIKIDVQGWEFEVLKGMDKLLVDSPATNLYFELWPQGLSRAGSSMADIFAWLQARGFQLYRAGSLAHLDDRALATLDQEVRGLKYIDIYATRDPIGN